MLGGFGVDHRLLLLHFLHRGLFHLELGGVALPCTHLPAGAEAGQQEDAASCGVGPRWNDHATGIPALIQLRTSKQGQALTHSLAVIWPSWLRSGDQSRWPRMPALGFFFMKSA